jgi:hypothetical protein
MPQSADVYIQSSLFWIVITPRVSPIVIVIMYHLVPTPQSFEIEGENTADFSLSLFNSEKVNHNTKLYKR